MQYEKLGPKSLQKKQPLSPLLGVSQENHSTQLSHIGLSPTSIPCRLPGYWSIKVKFFFKVSSRRYLFKLFIHFIYQPQSSHPSSHPSLPHPTMPIHSSKMVSQQSLVYSVVARPKSSLPPVEPAWGRKSEILKTAQLLKLSQVQM